MSEFFRPFLSTNGFMPHGHCYLWTPSLVWTMVIADSLIFFAYTAISILLYRLVQRIRLPFSAMFLAFGVFIAACGLTHLMEVWTIWNSTYWISAFFKVITAIASVTTAIWLFFLRRKIVGIAEAAKLSENRRIQLEKQSVELQQVSRLKSEFLANMSHELRTPLNAIMGFSALMLEGRTGSLSPDQKEYIDDILTSSRHLLRLVNDVLDLAKVESGKFEFHPEKIEIPKLLEEVKDILRGLASEKRITVSTVIDPAAATATLDPAKLKQVLYNYLSNAIKFTPNEGHVTVRFSAAENDGIRIEVEDTGVGISPKDMAQLFVEFQQLDSGTSKRHPGTGLGLALTKRIVEAQGGSVAVQSKPGEGSTFTAILPQFMKSAEEEPGSSSQLVSKNLPTVLVIEDDVKDRAWIVHTLERAGYFVEAVSSGREAIERCRERQYSMITLDLLLPDSSGWAVLNEIRATPLNREVPAIVVTVCADSSTGSGFEVHDFLVKPIQEEVLLASLKRAHIVPPGMGPILLVDDDSKLLKIMADKLTDLGYRPVVKFNGAEALEAIKKETPAAIILDLLMPGMSGFEFIDKFRKSSMALDVPIIVWTAKDLTMQERAQLRDSAKAVVLKTHGGTVALVEELRRCLVAAHGG